MRNLQRNGPRNSLSVKVMFVPALLCDYVARKLVKSTLFKIDRQRKICFKVNTVFRISSRYLVMAIGAMLIQYFYATTCLGAGAGVRLTPSEE